MWICYCHLVDCPMMVLYFHCFLFPLFLPTFVDWCSMVICSFPLEERSREPGMFISKRKWRTKNSNISESLEAFPTNASYLVYCLTGPPSVTNHVGLPTKVPHLWKPLNPKHTGLVGQPSYHTHWCQSPQGWPTEVSEGVWQPFATRNREELDKGPDGRQ